MFRKALAAAACGMMLTAALTACGEKNISISESGNSAATTTNAAAQTTESSNIAFGSDVRNFTAPEDGEEILILTIKDYGDIKIKLFPEYAQKGVENIKGLANKDYYTNVIFHRIIDGFMIQGGDPTGTGRGGESIYGDRFDGGVDPHLIHAAGAVAYANSGSTATDGSQFYIVTGKTYAEKQFAEDYPESAKKVYMENGGTPWLDGSYTVFGQVFDGLDIVFKLQKVATDGSDRPLENVVIESMKVATYDGSALKWKITDYPDFDAEETSEASTEASTETSSDTAAASSDASEASSETTEASSEAAAQ